MTYQRKTRDEWQMWSNYGYGWEHEISEDSWRDMRQSLKEYRENCPNASFRAKKVRVKIEHPIDELPTFPNPKVIATYKMVRSHD